MLFWQIHGHATFLNRRCLHRVHAVLGNCAFGVAVRFGGVGEPDPGGGKNAPAGLVRRAGALEKTAREANHRCYF